MYVCLKIYIWHALNKVTDAPRSQTNKNVFNARLKRSVDRSNERKEVGRLFQILDPATAKRVLTINLHSPLIIINTLNLLFIEYYKSLDNSVHKIPTASGPPGDPHYRK